MSETVATGVARLSRVAFASLVALSVPKASLTSAAEPEKDTVEAFSELAPQTVRLLVWR